MRMNQSKISSVFKIYRKTDPKLNAKIIDVDGKTRTEGVVFKVFDHHRTGEVVNLDTIPAEINVSGYELATHLFDTDYILSAVTLHLGGRSRVGENDLRLMRSASEWCDQLDSTESDKEIRQLGLGLHLYIMGRYIAKRDELGRVRGEVEITADGKTKPDLSDATDSEIAGMIADEIIQAIANGELIKLQDVEYLSHREENQELFRKSCILNDDVLAITIANEFIDPLFSYELVKGDIQVNGSKKVDKDGSLIGYKYTVGIKPIARGNYNLLPLIGIFNQVDPHVIDQIARPGHLPITWGGRESVFGSPFNIHSGLDPKEIEKIIKENLGEIKV